MHLYVRSALTATTLACVVCALVISVSAQITVTSPTNGSTVPMPVWVRAHNAGCNGNSPNAFGYSIGNSPFITWGITDLDIDSTDYRMNSPGTYTVHFKEGKPVSKDLVSKKVVAAVDEVVLMGNEGFQTSRHKFERGRVLTMNASAYDPSPITIPGTCGRTAMGLRAGYGVVAVDPRVIPLGSLVYVEGYGFAIAADTGGAIKGNRIDLCYDLRTTALQFGRKKVKVHVLRGT